MTRKDWQRVQDLDGKVLYWWHKPTGYKVVNVKNYQFNGYDPTYTWNVVLDLRWTLPVNVGNNVTDLKRWVENSNRDGTLPGPSEKSLNEAWGV